METSTASGNLSSLDTINFENQYPQFGFIPQVITLILTILMAGLYGFYEYFHMTNNGRSRTRTYQITGPFVLAEHHQNTMKTIVLLVAFVNAIQFLAFVVWRKFSTLVSISIFATTIPALVVGVFVKVEFVLLIIVTVLQVTNSSCSKKAMRRVIRTLHIFFWIIKFLSCILALHDASSWTGITVFCTAILATTGPSTEFLAINVFLVVASVFFIWNRNSPDSKRLPTQLGVQILIIAAARVVHIAFILRNSCFTLLFDKTFHNELGVFDQLVMPISVMIAHFVGVKRTSKQVVPRRRSNLRV